MEILENINFSENASLSDSEFTFTRSELESSKDDYKFQNGGGLFCNDELTDILLGCLSDSRPDIACYLFCKLQKFPKELSKTDESGRNILHYMTIFASHGNMVLHIAKLAKTISKSEFSNALNKQDINGNTCLHYSAKLGFNNLTKLYIEYGADCSIRNNDGYFVEEDNLQSEKKPVDVSVIVVTDTPNNINYDMFQNINEASDTDTMIPMTRTDRNATPTANRFSSTSHLDSVNFFKEVEAQLDKANDKLQNPQINRKYINKENNEIGNLESVSTQQIIHDILANVKGVNSDVQQEELSVNTESIIKDIIKTQNQQGGAKKKKSSKKDSKSDKKDSNKSRKKKSKISRISGERKLTMYSEISVSPIGSDDEDVSAIARQISRQSSDIHERVLEKIMKLLKLDENNADDVNKARNYKAAIYKMVKEKNPLLNNFDRAVEMEKSITLELLKSIDIEKVTKEIEKHLSEKSASDKTASVKTASDKTASVTTSTVTEKKKTSKSTQKRIPEFNQNLSESSTFQIMQESSISFSTVSEF